MRDYYDMPEIASRFDRVTPTFNMVPGLLLQIQEYAREEAAGDLFFRMAMKHPEELSQHEKSFLVENFFGVHPDTMLRPYPRFAELAGRAGVFDGGPNAESVLPGLCDQDLADLQVWFFLSWTGRTLRKDPRVAELLTKGRDFSQDDKEQLRQAVCDLLARIIPLYRDLAFDGQIEVSCSPMYHPILPLLVDTDSALEAMPDMNCPAARFSFPEDARRHVSQGLDLISGLMEQRVAGMWPSEGSISTRVLQMLDSEGVRWIATDEKMLFAGLKERTESRADLLYTPWKFGDTALFFRDARLSDLIGFEYSRWDPEAAVRHFLEELATASLSSRLREPVITISMDGENAWEYYVHGGMRFVELLYRGIQEDDRFELVSPSEVIADGAFPTLDRVGAGSWIDGTFSTWIGDPVKNMAWEHLTSARNASRCFLQKNRVGDRERAELMDLVMRAEASDWFWWFGEGHTSRHDPEFDLLFRQHLQAIYRKLGESPPDALSRPVQRADFR